MLIYILATVTIFTIITQHVYMFTISFQYIYNFVIFTINTRFPYVSLLKQFIQQLKLSPITLAFLK